MTDRRTILKASLLAPAMFARPASAADRTWRASK